MTTGSSNLWKKLLAGANPAIFLGGTCLFRLVRFYQPFNAIPGQVAPNGRHTMT